MIEFDEIALKKMVKEYLIDRVYYRINLVAGRWGISNAEISKQIGWDPAGYNQKYSRSNDLRITTFIKIYTALEELISKREKQSGCADIGLEKIRLDEFITDEEIDIGHLFNHISAAAEDREEFLEDSRHIKAFLQMRSFVLLGQRNKKFNEREVAVYAKYYLQVQQGKRGEL